MLSKVSAFLFTPFHYPETPKKAHRASNYGGGLERLFEPTTCPDYTTIPMVMKGLDVFNERLVLIVSKSLLPNEEHIAYEL